jgi:hypothetical protein
MEHFPHQHVSLRCSILLPCSWRWVRSWWTFWIFGISFWSFNFSVRLPYHHNYSCMILGTHVSLEPFTQFELFNLIAASHDRWRHVRAQMKADLPGVMQPCLSIDLLLRGEAFCIGSTLITTAFEAPLTASIFGSMTRTSCCIALALMFSPSCWTL